jgi:hypothetical protein
VTRLRAAWLRRAELASAGPVSGRPPSVKSARVRTLLPTVLVACLLCGTAAAFAIAEHLKLETAPITATHVDKVFSPICRCPRRVAHVEFRLTRANRLSLSILDRDGDVVRTLVHGRRFGRGRKRFTWNGRDAEGRVVRDGEYRPRVKVGSRTIVLPNPIQVDTTRPRIVLVAVRPGVLRPSGRGAAIHVRYRVDEPAHALLLVDGVVRVRTRWQRRDELAWYGRVGGRVLPPGRHRLQLAAEDPAGNRSRPTRVVEFRIERASS